MEIDSAQMRFYNLAGVMKKLEYSLSTMMTCSYLLCGDIDCETWKAMHPL